MLTPNQPLPTLPASDDPAALATALAVHYPRTVAAFRTMPDGLARLRHVYELTRRWQSDRPAPTAVVTTGSVPPLPAATTFDVIIAGGVTGLLYATLLAVRQRRRVLVFDRAPIGQTHREWNISPGELQTLRDLDLFTDAELDELVARRYRTGLVRFHAASIRVPPTELQLDDVLNLAIDADALLTRCRQRLLATDTGSQLIDGLTFQRAITAASGPTRVLVEATDAANTTHQFVGRLLIDTLGTSSPIAAALRPGQPFDGLCPTVGTVARGYAQGQAAGEVDPEVGEILVTVADATAGWQPIWEGFPGRDDRLTVYLFYYDQARREANLLALFEHYFRLLPTYKRPGPDFAHLKPVYGYIPARYRGQRGAPPSPAVRRGLLCLGDAAAQQSSLTFTGFGSAIRSLPRIDTLLAWCLRHDLLEPQHLRHITAGQPNLSLLWVFGRFMQPPPTPWGQPHTVNELLNVFCAVLNELGPPLADRFFKDRFGWRDYTRLTLHTARRYPRVFPLTLATLGPRATLHWLTGYVWFSLATLRGHLTTTLHTALPPRLSHTLAQRWPALTLPWLATLLAHQTQAARPPGQQSGV